MKESATGNLLSRWVSVNYSEVEWISVKSDCRGLLISRDSVTNHRVGEQEWGSVEIDSRWCITPLSITPPHARPRFCFQAPPNLPSMMPPDRLLIMTNRHLSFPIDCLSLQIERLSLQIESLSLQTERLPFQISGLSFQIRGFCEDNIPSTRKRS